MDGQMKRGVLEMCLLYMIAQEETYGYRLLQRMAGVFPDQQERTAYAILRRLLACGYTEAFSASVSAGPPRKYYRITQDGKKYLTQLVEEWGALAHAVTTLGVAPLEQNN